MCRLFGFRSNESARVHDALVTERNALRLQSIEHRDGWGIAHYDAEGRPRVARYCDEAIRLVHRGLNVPLAEAGGQAGSGRRLSFGGRAAAGHHHARTAEFFGRLSNRAG